MDGAERGFSHFQNGFSLFWKCDVEEKPLSRREAEKLFALQDFSLYLKACSSQPPSSLLQPSFLFTPFPHFHFLILSTSSLHFLSQLPLCPKLFHSPFSFLPPALPSLSYPRLFLFPRFASLHFLFPLFSLVISSSILFFPPSSIFTFPFQALASSKLGPLLPCFFCSSSLPHVVYCRPC